MENQNTAPQELSDEQNTEQPMESLAPVELLEEQNVEQPLESLAPVELLEEQNIEQAIENTAPMELIEEEKIEQYRETVEISTIPEGKKEDTKACEEEPYIVKLFKTLMNPDNQKDQDSKQK